MTHEEIGELLACVRAGRRRRRRVRGVERHLEQCPRCRAELDAFRDVAAALGNTVAPLPEGLWLSIVSRLTTTRMSRPRCRGSSRPGRATPRRRTPPSSAGRDSRRLRRRRVHPGCCGRRCRDSGVRTDPDQRRGVPAPSGARIPTDRRGLCARDARPQGHQPRQRRRTDARPVRPGRRAGVPRLVGPSCAQVVGDLPALGCRQGPAHLAGLLGQSPSDSVFTLAGSSAPSQLRITVEPSGGSVVPSGALAAAGPV